MIVLYRAKKNASPFGEAFYKKLPRLRQYPFTFLGGRRHPRHRQHSSHAGEQALRTLRVFLPASYREQMARVAHGSVSNDASIRLRTDKGLRASSGPRAATTQPVPGEFAWGGSGSVFDDGAQGFPFGRRPCERLAFPSPSPRRLPLRLRRTGRPCFQNAGRSLLSSGPPSSSLCRCHWCLAPCSRKERAATERMFWWFRALCSGEYRMPLRVRPYSKDCQEPKGVSALAPASIVILVSTCRHERFP